VNAVIVLLLLGVIWAAVLIPPWVQSRRETRPIESMRSFHRQLWLLERTSPAHRRGSVPRRRVASSAVTVYGGPSGYSAGDVYDDEFGDAAYDDEFEAYERYDDIGVDELGEFDELDDVDELDVVQTDAAIGLQPVRWAGEDRWAEVAEARRRRLAAERSPAAARRRLQGYRRRRRVLSTLLLVAIATAPPAALVGGVGWWVAHAVADTLLVGYVALLVRRRSVEREEKVHYLAPIRAPRPPVVVLHGGAAP
jgi:hypothetical protein